MAKKIDISKLRKRLKLSQVQLADQLGVDQATVSRLEAGRTPSKPVLKLLELLNA
jgi:DNA-binding transcriptional regulator YiaG